ncbi:hypothetical protein Pcinc_011510 [Petrolisthes cinctipes]|uniref:Ionotropic glutamate receptor C-terminal domain-containing protein n=1 Tax=Petrolisthes cinctipes TaxID=88211 RepID=A0AAE1G0W2_PETCI|nr:hypothetical protein Pcinc_011510 [Petrolisthes cinctipes]
MNNTEWFQQLAHSARQVRQRSWCSVVVVVSESRTFLATLANWSLKGRLLVWATRLLVVTRLTFPHLHSLLSSHWTFSMMNTIFLNLEQLRPNLSFFGDTVNVSALPFMPFWGEVVEGVASDDGSSSVTRYTGSDYYLLITVANALNFTVRIIKPATWFELHQVGRTRETSRPPQFLHGLVKSLIKPWAEERICFPGQHTKTQQVIKSVFLELNSPARIPANLTANKRCWVCLTKKDRKTRTPCINCKNPATKLVYDRVAYICPVYHILMPVRFEQHDFTFSYEFSYFSFAMAKPSLKPQWQSLYYPLDGLVWLLVLLMLLCTPLFLIMVIRGREHQYLSSSDGMGVSVVMQDMTGMLLGQNLPSRLPVTTSSRVLVAAWLVFVFIIGSAYRGNLTASLTVPKFPPRIESLEQLVIGVDRVTIPSFGEIHRKFYSESDSPLFQGLARLLQVGPSFHEGLTAANEKKLVEF